MNDAGAVRLGQRRYDLHGDVDRGREAHRGAGRVRPERHAVDEFVGDEVRARGLADVENRDDVGVIERRRGPGFAHEARQAIVVRIDGAGQDLQRDAAVETRVLREIHLAHPTLAERREDLVVPESGTLVQTHVVRATRCNCRGSTAPRPLRRGGSVGDQRTRFRRSCASHCRARQRDPRGPRDHIIRRHHSSTKESGPPWPRLRRTRPAPPAAIRRRARTSHDRRWQTGDG